MLLRMVTPPGRQRGIYLRRCLGPHRRPMRADAVGCGGGARGQWGGRLVVGLPVGGRGRGKGSGCEWKKMLLIFVVIDACSRRRVYDPRPVACPAQPAPRRSRARHDASPPCPQPLLPLLADLAPIAQRAGDRPGEQRSGCAHERPRLLEKDDGLSNHRRGRRPTNVYSMHSTHLHTRDRQQLEKRRRRRPRRPRYYIDDVAGL